MLREIILEAKDFIVDDINNGKVINKNYNQWNSVKTETDYGKWKDATRKLLFGDKNILRIINNFNPKKDSPNRIGYIKELKKILK